ncbi:hypothetical protein ACNKHM_21090 [Shigella sonnei]
MLGLGNIRALAGKPVMKGKGVIFKKFAGIDVFDIEVDPELDPDKFIEDGRCTEPTFGGINLEAIKAPECFYPEQKLRKRVNLRYCTTISTARQLSALPPSSTACAWWRKRLQEDVRMVVSGTVPQQSPV